MAALRHKMKEHKKHGGHMKRKAGGATNEHEYNAVGAPEQKEAHDTKEGFKRGGKKHKKGGKVEAEKSMHRPDKKPRRAAGGSVMSSASKKAMASKDEAGQGHEGDGPKGEDPDRGCYKSGGALTSRERNALPKDDFVLKAERKYPIDTENRGRNALARVSQFGSSAEKSKVRSAVHRKYPGIGKKG